MPAANENSTTNRLLLGTILGVTAAWSFWPTLANLVATWRVEPDYSHGFLVPLVALAMLWFRRDRCPIPSNVLSPGGLLLIGLSFTMRAASGVFFYETIDGWAIMMWIAGAVWLLWGWQVLKWSLPAVAFLIFMIPLPFRLEHSLSYPLQSIACTGSVWILQTIGQPAFAEGHTILLGEHVLEVERACAGLRIFMGIVAAAFAWSVLGTRHWLDRILLVVCALPIAICANVLRIVITAVCFVYCPTWFAERVAHDAAGWLMVPLAAILMGAVHWYLGCLWTEQVSLRMTDAMQRHRGSLAPSRRG